MGNGPIINTDNGASKWGAETNTQKMIGQAAQYNPATKLGITNADQPAKGNTGMPTSQQVLTEASQEPVRPPIQGQGLGPASGLEPAGAQPLGPSFASGTLAEHYAHLAGLPEASPIVQFYARRKRA